MSSLERPPAAVRMMTPPVKPCCSRNSRTMPRRRPRSSRESILRETPTWSTVGMKTRNRPGMVTCDVRRAPLVPSGSLTTWTRMSCPSLSRSSILASGRSRSCGRGRGRVRGARACAPRRERCLARRLRPARRRQRRASAAGSATFGRPLGDAAPSATASLGVAAAPLPAAACQRRRPARPRRRRPRRSNSSTVLTTSET